MWIIALFYYFIIIALCWLSRLEPIVFGVFSLGGIKGPRTAITLVFITLTTVILDVSGYVTAPAKSQASTFESNDLSLFPWVKL